MWCFIIIYLDNVLKIIFDGNLVGWDYSKLVIFFVFSESSFSF